MSPQSLSPSPVMRSVAVQARDSKQTPPSLKTSIGGKPPFLRSWMWINLVHPVLVQVHQRDLDIDTAKDDTDSDVDVHSQTSSSSSGTSMPSDLSVKNVARISPFLEIRQGHVALKSPKSPRLSRQTNNGASKATSQLAVLPGTKPLSSLPKGRNPSMITGPPDRSTTTNRLRETIKEQESRLKELREQHESQRVRIEEQEAQLDSLTQYINSRNVRVTDLESRIAKEMSITRDLIRIMGSMVRASP